AAIVVLVNDSYVESQPLAGIKLARPVGITVEGLNRPLVGRQGTRALKFHLRGRTLDPSVDQRRVGARWVSIDWPRTWNRGVLEHGHRRGVERVPPVSGWLRDRSTREGSVDVDLHGVGAPNVCGRDDRLIVPNHHSQIDKPGRRIIADHE